MSKKGWCQRVAARDDLGRACYPESRLAREWCIYGAIEATYSQRNSEKADKLYKDLYKILHAPLGVWNDHPTRTKQEVIDLLKSIGE